LALSSNRSYDLRIARLSASTSLATAKNRSEYCDGLSEWFFLNFLEHRVPYALRNAYHFAADEQSMAPFGEGERGYLLYRTAHESARQSLLAPFVHGFPQPLSIDTEHFADRLECKWTLSTPVCHPPLRLGE